MLEFDILSFGWQNTSKQLRRDCIHISKYLLALILDVLVSRRIFLILVKL
jgi:hypothetical protein